MAIKSPETNFNAAHQFVDFALGRQREGAFKSASGPGSSREAASASLKLIDEVVVSYEVKSILDLGCGDWNWMNAAKWRQRPKIAYEGWEAHVGLVEYLVSSFGNERTKFFLRDANVHAFPSADLVICRDVLFHLPISTGVELAKRIRAARALFISTSFPSIERNDDIVPNSQIPGWGHYLVNLDIEPFHFGPFRRRALAENLQDHHAGPSRYVCLYDFREIEKD